MLTSPTVFVIGAGCSAHYSFPTGLGLLNRIQEISGEIGNDQHSSIVAGLGVSRGDITSFTQALHKSRSRSIDDYITADLDRAKIGKILIAWALIPQEVWAFNQGCKGGDIYRSLLDLIKAPTFDELKRNQVTFLTFNYDRSLDIFLLSALSHHYGKSAKEVSQVLNPKEGGGIQIIHLHGSLSPLPEENPDHEDFLIPFGRGNDFLTVQGIKCAADNIKIVSENIQTEEVKLAKEKILSAEQICFLGFGFHETNLQRLGFGKEYLEYLATSGKAPKDLSISHICSSGRGMRTGDRKRVENSIGYPIRWAPIDFDCDQALHEVFYPNEETFVIGDGTRNSQYAYWIRHTGCDGRIKTLNNVENYTL